MPVPLVPDHFTTESHCCACLTGDWPHDAPVYDECEFCCADFVLLCDGRTIRLAQTMDGYAFLPVHYPPSNMLAKLTTTSEYRATVRVQPRECLGIYRTNNPIPGCAGPDGTDDDFLCIRCRMQQETEQSQRHG